MPFADRGRGASCPSARRAARAAAARPRPWRRGYLRFGGRHAAVARFPRASSVCIGSQGGMRNARSSRSMEAAHLDGVLREPADVALHQHQVLGRIARRRSDRRAGRRARSDAPSRAPPAARSGARRRAAQRRTSIRNRRAATVWRAAAPGIVIECRSTRPTVVSSSSVRMCAAERDGAEHRAAIGIEHDRAPFKSRPLREMRKSRARYRR